MRARLNWALSAAVAFAAVSCGTCSKKPSTSGPADAGTAVTVGNDAPQRGGTLVVRVMTEPTTLNFLEGPNRESWTSRLTAHLVTESLLDIDPTTSELVPGLAEKFVETEDHHVTTLTLRRGVRFHDQTEFGARDVVAVFDAVKDPAQNTASARGEFDELIAWRALDDSTVELRWRTPSVFALRALAKLPMLPAAALKTNWAGLASAPIGTGPFAVEAWARGQTLTLRKVNADDPRALLDTIVFRFVKDSNVASGLFERGEVDLYTNVQPPLWKEVERTKPPDVVMLRGVDNSYSYIAWNEAVPALADVRVRRALGHLYPTQLIEKTVDLGLEQPTTCPFWAQGPSCDPSVEPLTHSLDQARADLLDAGFHENENGLLERDGVPLRLRFLMPATSVRLAKVVPLLQEQFRQVGAELTSETVDISHMGARVAARDFEVTSRVWTELDTVQDQFSTFHSSQVDGGANFVQYSSPATDALLLAIRQEWAPEKRHALERALHRQLYADQPYFFMTARSSFDLAKRRVHGLSPSPLWYDLRRVWVQR